MTKKAPPPPLLGFPRNYRCQKEKVLIDRAIRDPVPLDEPSARLLRRLTTYMAPRELFAAKQPPKKKRELSRFNPVPRSLISPP